MHFRYFRMSADQFDKLLFRTSSLLLPGEDVLSGPVTVLDVHVTRSQDFVEVHVGLRCRVPIGLCVYGVA